MFGCFISDASGNPNAISPPDEPLLLPSLVSTNPDNDPCKLENKRLFHTSVSESRQAKMFYWEKSGITHWASVVDRETSPAHSVSKKGVYYDSLALRNFRSGRHERSPSPMRSVDDADYEAADDASIISSTTGYFSRADYDFDHTRRGSVSSLKQNLGLNIDHIDSPEDLYQPTLESVPMYRSRSDGEISIMRSSHFPLKHSIVIAKKICDEEFSALFKVMEEDRRLVPGTSGSAIHSPNHTQYPDIEPSERARIATLIEVMCNIQVTDPSYLLNPDFVRELVNRIRSCHSQSDKLCAQYVSKALFAFSGLARIVVDSEDLGGEALSQTQTGSAALGVPLSAGTEMAQLTTSFSPIFSNDASPSSEASRMLGLQYQSESRTLCRPWLVLFSEKPSVAEPSGIRQEFWTHDELKGIAEEGLSFNIVMVIRRNGRVDFISPSVEAIFGTTCGFFWCVVAH